MDGWMNGRTDLQKDRSTYFSDLSHFCVIQREKLNFKLFYEYVRKGSTDGRKDKATYRDASPAGQRCVIDVRACECVFVCARKGRKKERKKIGMNRVWEEGREERRKDRSKG